MSKDFVLKMGDGNSPPVFTVVARLRSASGHFLRSQLVGSGTVESPEAIAKLNDLMENGEATDCLLVFGSGQRIAGKFRLRQFALASDASGRLGCTIALVQASPVDTA